MNEVEGVRNVSQIAQIARGKELTVGEKVYFKPDEQSQNYAKQCVPMQSRPLLQIPSHCNRRMEQKWKETLIPNIFLSYYFEYGLNLERKKLKQNLKLNTECLRRKICKNTNSKLPQSAQQVIVTEDLVCKTIKISGNENNSNNEHKLDRFTSHSRKYN